MTQSNPFLTKSYRWLVVVVGLCMVGGCTPPRVGDLRLASIEIVDPIRESVPTELSGWRPEGRVLKLSFFTATNIRDIARKYNLHMRVDVYSCGDKARGLAQLQVLFDTDGVVAENPVARSSASGSDFWIYVAEKSGPRKDIETDESSIPAYDLVEQPMDICVQLHGRNMAMEGFSSNVVTVASEEMTQALAPD